MKTTMRHALGLMLPVLLLFCVPASAQKWEKLFDGKSLEGWHTLPGGEWKVEEGAIVGRQEKSDKRYGLLVSNKTYKNFVVKVKYKALKGNSGFYFRAQEVGGEVGVHGFQAEIDPTKDAGGLYETGGRGWVSKPKPEDVKTWYKPNEWNQMEITAIGNTITVKVNGKVSAQLPNDPSRTEGHLAMQLHANMEMLVMFKDIKIKELAANAK